MIGRHAAAIGLAVLFAIVFASWGTSGVADIVFFGSSLALAAVVAGAGAIGGSIGALVGNRGQAAA